MFRIYLLFGFLLGFVIQGRAQGLSISPSGTVTLQSGGMNLYATGGFGPGTYQWTRNYVDPVGSTAETLWVTQPGYYQVISSNGVQTVTATAVRVIPAPTTPGSVDKNFVYEQIVPVEGATNVNQLQSSGSYYSGYQTIRYTDGFGRAIQDVGVQASPFTYDVVVPHSYDAAGREARAYLPYTIASNGQLRTNAVAEQQNFYTYAYKVARWSTGPAYSETVFEDSPLNRVLEHGAPGASWQIQRTSSGESTFQGHTTKGRTRSNTTNEQIPLWSYTPGSSGTLGTTSFSWASSQTLLVAEAKDEDGRLSQTYTNTQGQLVSRRNAIPTTNTGSPTTCYAYDAAGRTSMVMTPAGVRRAVFDNETVDADFLERWAYFFEYDELGRQCGQKVPGKAWTYSVYDPWNRIVATQNGNQRVGPPSQWKWSYVKYDELNRPVITGTYFYSGTRADLAAAIQTDVDAGTIGRYETSGTNTAITGTTIGYSLDKSYPKNPPTDQLLTVTYFDNYAFAAAQYPSLGYLQEASSTGITSPATPTTRTLGMQTTRA